MIPSDLKYTAEHEWAKIEGDTMTVGITEYAQGELGDIVFVEFPAVGDEITKDESFGTIEAVKAVSDLYAPITGTVVAINEALADAPDAINSDPYGDGWMIKIKIADAAELDSLLSSDQYGELV
ncbi:MAG: glycine cleavage system protein GcvH [Calditrichia bacterium]